MTAFVTEEIVIIHDFGAKTTIFARKLAVVLLSIASKQFNRLQRWVRR